MAILRISDLPPVQVDRNSLRQQVATILRDLIVTGKIQPGTKITERDVAEMLNISRMPARDALLDLEHQGLVVSKPGGRYVIKLTSAEARKLYQVRLALEKLAVEEAIKVIDEAGKTGIQQKLADMRQAVAENDTNAYTSSDLEFHELIWQITDNQYLLQMLSSMVGPIFLFMSTQTRFHENWRETLDLHTALAKAICDQNLDAALRNIEEHMQASLELALMVFKNGQ